MSYDASSTTFSTRGLCVALPSPPPRAQPDAPTSPPSSFRVPSSSSSSSSTSPRRIRPSPPRLVLPDVKEGDRDRDRRVRPVLFVQPASPALSDPPSSPPLALSASPTSTTFPDPPLPLPLVAAAPPFASEPQPPPRANTAPAPLAFSSSPSTSSGPVGAGGGLAARRAAKLGKKRLSLVVPTPATTGRPPAAAATAAEPVVLLSPTTPSHLYFQSTSTVRNGGQDFVERGDNDDDAGPPGSSSDASSSSSTWAAVETTRSLPPSPISLVTFIGTEGSEQPDRTIGRLMLKQQADEMREQMRGGRGMKRRTSIPRLNLAAATAAAASATAPGGGGGVSPAGKSRPTLALGGARGGGGGANRSAVEYLRRDTSEDSTDGQEGDVEEFPYALGPREILPGIYLGSEQNAKDPAVLSEWKFGFVLNVAKEVDCPWVDEVIPHKSVDDPPNATGAPKKGYPTSPPRRHKHRRTKTQAANVVRPSLGPAAPSHSNDPRPVRPPFIRPTASTPNLQSVFRSSSTGAANPTSLPPVPPVPKLSLPDSSSTGEDMLRSLSSSPPNPFPPGPRCSPPRPRAAAAAVPAVPARPASTCRSKGVVRFAPNSDSGRPALEYLWLKWGHDEADLVEANKFQHAFDFLDEARERGERVLVHCQCGVSRSATVVIAYCMREAAKALEQGRDAKELSGCTGMHDTYSFVKEKSEWVGPNLGLVFQLVAYERTLRGDANDQADDEESGYPRYPPEPVSDDSQHDARFPVYPQTPVSLDGSASRSQFSTPDLHLPLSPTFSNGTSQSSVTSTPVTIQLADALAQPHIATPNEDDADDRPEFGIRDRHGSAETLKGPDPAVFVLTPPPVPTSTSNRALREDLVSPTVAAYPSPALSPLELPSKGSRRRLPPPISLGGGDARSGAPSPTTTTTTTLVTPATPHRTNPAAVPSLPSLTTTGLSDVHLSQPSPLNGLAVTSPDSAITTSSDSSTSLSPAAVVAHAASSPNNNSSTTTTTNGVKKFGAQSKSERRASHRRVFSETIQVPQSIMTKSPSSTSNRSSSSSSSSGSHTLQPSTPGNAAAVTQTVAGRTE